MKPNYFQQCDVVLGRDLERLMELQSLQDAANLVPAEQKNLFRAICESLSYAVLIVYAIPLSYSKLNVRKRT